MENDMNGLSEVVVMMDVLTEPLWKVTGKTIKRSIALKDLENIDLALPKAISKRLNKFQYTWEKYIDGNEVVFDGDQPIRLATIMLVDDLALQCAKALAKEYPTMKVYVFSEQHLGYNMVNSDGELAHEKFDDFKVIANQ